MEPRPRTDYGAWPRAAAIATPSSEAIAVLLVEDDDGDALLVEDLLAEALPHAHITRSRTFEQALAELDTGFDCVLLDLKLPDAEGMDTVLRVRTRAPQTPLIVLTGLSDEAAGAAAVDAGAQDYLIKGEVDGGQLARAIRYAIGRRMAADAQQQLRLAEVQSREVARLERGLAPRPLIGDQSIWIASQYRAGRNRALLGGDFFDVAETPEGLLRAVIGDVCGHGPDEAAIGVCLRAAWRALTVAGVERELVLPAMQRVLEHERALPHLFTTLCMLEIDSERDAAHMILAGHPPPILIDGSAVAILPREHGGAPIGIGDEQWSAAAVELPPDWTMLLYTDGIVEGRVDGSSRRLGADGLQGLLSEMLAARADWREQPGDLLAELIARVEQFNDGDLTDDVAVLLIGSVASMSKAS